MERKVAGGRRKSRKLIQKKRFETSTAAVEEDETVEERREEKGKIGRGRVGSWGEPSWGRTEPILAAESQSCVNSSLSSILIFYRHLRRFSPWGHGLRREEGRKRRGERKGSE